MQAPKMLVPCNKFTVFAITLALMYVEAKGMHAYDECGSISVGHRPPFRGRTCELRASGRHRSCQTEQQRHLSQTDHASIVLVSAVASAHVRILGRVDDSQHDEYFGLGNSSTLLLPCQSARGLKYFADSFYRSPCSFCLTLDAIGEPVGNEPVAHSGLYSADSLKM